MIWRSIALRASLQSSFADSAILSALQNSARDPLRTFTRVSTANPHASAEAAYAPRRSSASRHFILRLSVPQSYPSLRRTRWSIALCTTHLKAHWIIVKKQNRFHSLCPTAPGRRPTAAPEKASSEPCLLGAASSSVHSDRTRSAIVRSRQALCFSYTPRSCLEILCDAATVL